MHDYLKRAGELWEDSTGTRHDNSPETMVLWRDQVIKGLPKPVQTALEDVVNLETQPFHDWKQTVTHCYTRHQRKMDQEDDEVKALTKRLLKAQIAEKDNETNKKKAKAVPQMSAMSNLHVDIQDIVAQLLREDKEKQQKQPMTAPAPPAPQPDWSVWPGAPYAQQPYYPAPRGGGPRGGYRSRGSPRHENCFHCGAPDHWAKQCTLPSRGGSQGPQGSHSSGYRGQGGPRGGSFGRGRGRGQPPHANQMPASGGTPVDRWDPEQSY
ncbi:hypothetical protein NQZ68_008819 [Dissostichus eleginoides]|nr:hypothetical protein NQZ68_008819 [Dissostichus eleginoides]